MDVLAVFTVILIFVIILLFFIIGSLIYLFKQNSRKEESSYQLISKDDLVNIVLNGIGNSELKNFVDIFNSCSRELEIDNMGNIDFNFIEDNFKQHINTLVNKVNKDPNLLNNIQDEQVFFMIKLKLLLDEKINEWVRDYKKG